MKIHQFQPFTMNLMHQTSLNPCSVPIAGRPEQGEPFKTTPLQHIAHVINSVLKSQ